MIRVQRDKEQLEKGRQQQQQQKRKKRILPTAKCGGLLPVFGTIGSLIDGAAGVTKAVGNRRAAARQLEELQRHNRVLIDRGLYLAPHTNAVHPKEDYAEAPVVKQKKKTLRSHALDVALPSGVTTNIQLDMLARRLRIPVFRSVFMRDALPARVRANECGSVNLDALGPDAH